MGIVLSEEDMLIAKIITFAYVITYCLLLVMPIRYIFIIIISFLVYFQTRVLITGETTYEKMKHNNEKVEKGK